MPAEIINGWRVTSDTEVFRIFPKGEDGKPRPVTKVNQFLRLQRNGQLITVKRYWHRGEWFWRISTRDKAVYDIEVRDELSSVLFPVPGLRNGEGQRLGDRAKTDDVMFGFLTGRFQI